MLYFSVHLFIQLNILNYYAWILAFSFPHSLILWCCLFLFGPISRNLTFIKMLYFMQDFLNYSLIATSLWVHRECFCFFLFRVYKWYNVVCELSLSYIQMSFLCKILKNTQSQWSFKTHDVFVALFNVFAHFVGFYKSYLLNHVRLSTVLMGPS